MAASPSRSSAHLIRPARNLIDSWLHAPTANRSRLERHWPAQVVHWAIRDFYLNGYWQASARQAEGSKPGSGGQVTYRVAAVHRLVLWAGVLSTAGGSANPLEHRTHNPEKLSITTHRFPSANLFNSKCCLKSTASHVALD